MIGWLLPGVGIIRRWKRMWISPGWNADTLASRGDIRALRKPAIPVHRFPGYRFVVERVVRLKETCGFSREIQREKLR
jgi:hypothetical protein